MVDLLDVLAELLQHVLRNQFVISQQVVEVSFAPVEPDVGRRSLVKHDGVPVLLAAPA